MDLSVVPYELAGDVATDGLSPLGKKCYVEEQPGNYGKVKYGECLRNHAASIGGLANDGCGEFMPSGENNSLEALKCAACGCHRNFHRKNLAGNFDNPVVLYNASHGWGFKKSNGLLLPLLPQPVPISGCRSETPERDISGSRKRLRTKFTQEQKEKMLSFAEKLGWRIQKQDDIMLNEFCMEIGVKRHVLKVWMHNNKNTLGKKEMLEMNPGIEN